MSLWGVWVCEHGCVYVPLCCLWCQVEAVQQYNMLPPSPPKVSVFLLHLQRPFMCCIRSWALLGILVTQLYPGLYVHRHFHELIPLSTTWPLIPHIQICQWYQFCHCMQWQMNNGTRKALNFKWSSWVHYKQLSLVVADDENAVQCVYINVYGNYNRTTIIAAPLGNGIVCSQ